MEDSRIEEIIKACISKDGSRIKEPQSRIEELLITLYSAIKAGGASKEDIQAAVNKLAETNPELFGGITEEKVSELISPLSREIADYSDKVEGFMSEEVIYDILFTYPQQIGDTEGSINTIVTTTGTQQTFANDGYKSMRYKVEAGQKYRISGRGVNSTFPFLVFVNGDISETKNRFDVLDYFSNDNTTHTNYEFIIPKGCNGLIINQQNGWGYGCTFEKYRIGDFKASVREELQNIKKEMIDDWEIDSIGDRISRNNKWNELHWKPFDKPYFAFVIDDSNDKMPVFYKLFHEKGQPISTACIAIMLNKKYDGKTVDEWNKLIVADGGEVLAHYSGNLAEEDNVPDDGRTYLTSKEDWLSRTRDVKKIIESTGVKCRGLICADYTVQNTNYGENICQKYFEYSDGFGISTQYNLKREFLSSFSTLDKAKEWVDRCVQTNRFYPICFHGTDGFVTPETMSEFVDYIIEKGGIITTYAYVYDNFCTDALTAKLEEIERLFSQLS